MLVLSSLISKKLSQTRHLSLPHACPTDSVRQLPVFSQAEPLGADGYAGRAMSSSLDCHWWWLRASWARTEGVGFLVALLQAVGRVLFFVCGLATVHLSVQPVSVVARSWRRSLYCQQQRSRCS